MSQEQALNKLSEDIRLRGLALHTNQVYVACVSKFLDYSQVPINELDTQHARTFLSHLADCKLAPSTINCYAAAIRFFFAITLNRYLNYLQVPRVKRHKKLPIILSRVEVATLINACNDSKHKAFFLLAYGSGLRISEIVKLRTTDIRSKGEMRLFIRDAKGHKDRFTILSQNTLETLRDYWREYRPENPEGFLFPDTCGSKHIHSSDVATALQEALIRASITKKITCHGLRHQFASNLLEDGYSLLQIKDLLGHSSIRSTVIYLHIADTSKGIVSPADTLSAASFTDNSND